MARARRRKVHANAKPRRRGGEERAERQTKVKGLFSNDSRPKAHVTYRTWLLAALCVALVSFANRACLESGANPLTVHVAELIAIGVLMLTAALTAAHEKRHEARRATTAEPAAACSPVTACSPAAACSPAIACEPVAAAACAHAPERAHEGNSAPARAQDDFASTPICARQHTCARYVPMPLPLPTHGLSAAANPTTTANLAAEAQRAQLINRCGELAFEHGLSAREEEVLLMLAQGLSKHDIEEQLVISESTVKSHLRSIYRKIDVHSRAELNSLISPNDQPEPE